MKAAIKFIMTLAGLVLIGANIGTILLLTQFEGLLRKGVTRQAGQILQADVRLEAVRIDWQRQALELKGITIFNPPGYTDRDALRIESATLHPQMLTIFAKTPAIRQIALHETSLNLQHGAEGTNLGALMNHARAWSEEREGGNRWFSGRPATIGRLDLGPIRLQVDNPARSERGPALTLDGFSIEQPGGAEPSSGARTIHLVLRSMAVRLAALDGVVNSVRETLLLETSVESSPELLPDAAAP